jgi:hypothetical protein
MDEVFGNNLSGPCIREPYVLRRILGKTVIGALGARSGLHKVLNLLAVDVG